MTVKELKEALEGLDENLCVYGYSDLEEAGQPVWGVKVSTKFPYCRGDAPEDLPATFVLIELE